MGMKYNGVVQYEQEYGAFGQIGLLRDIKNGMEYRYEYDTVGRLLRSTGTPTSSNGFATLDFTNTDDPSLSTAQQRYWKNEGFYNGHNY
ncbi:MAG: hypothetical protein IJZ13_01320, partial [Clostridia bacterium]|nr:hypothetical protein [Clostridia bacterium]